MASNKIRSLADANATLAKLATLTAKIDDLNNAEAVEKEKLVEKYSRRRGPLSAQIMQHETELSKFAETNKDKIFNGARQITLDHGKIGFRSVTSLIIKNANNAVTLIRKAFPGRAAEAIITKESPSKEALKKWDSRDLKLIGAKLQTVENFYYETN